MNIERTGEFGERIALHFAVLNRDAEMTRALMELGSNARKGIWLHRDATTAHIIAKEREYDEIVAIIEQAEKRRRQVMIAPNTTVTSMTDVLQRAIRKGRRDEEIRLLDNDISLTGACNDQGATPLHAAAKARDTDIVA